MMKTYPVECSRCRGIGYIIELIDDTPLYWRYYKRVKCPRCKGKGIIQKEI